MHISPARRIAFQILRRVEDESAFSSALLAADEDLGAKDRALCHELVLGSLRRQLWLDRTIEHFASRQIASLDLAVVIALRLGLYQLRFLSRIPASAAINESVNLVKAARVKSAAGFVNAVLRRATREPNYDPGADVDDAIEKLSIQSSHPRWLIERWRDQFGFEAAAAIARANNEPAPVSLRLTAKAFHVYPQDPGEIIAELRTNGAELIESEIVPTAWRVRDDSSPHAGMRALQELSNQGLIYFQDEGSQLVAHLLGASDNERVLDVCAAPGSKSTLIAALAPQSEIMACDLYEHRVRTMRELAAQQQAGNIQFVVHDATIDLPFPPQSFDRVLVDAPCSGTGTLRHNPEIRWRLTPENIAELAARQTAILDNAAALVRLGGRLVYSTCSLETDENEAVIRNFRGTHFEFTATSISQAKLPSDAGTVRTWPDRQDVDGFFVAAFQRRAA